MNGEPAKSIFNTGYNGDREAYPTLHAMYPAETTPVFMGTQPQLVHQVLWTYPSLPLHRLVHPIAS